jgi:hypothetical protein
MSPEYGEREFELLFYWNNFCANAIAIVYIWIIEIRNDILLRATRLLTAASAIYTPFTCRGSIRANYIYL